MDNFVAIDFETANFAQSSVCSVGLVIVKDGEIVDNYYSLIRPIPNYYNERCSSVNGLCCLEPQHLRDEFREDIKKQKALYKE